jgi:hypothetical protein
MTNRIESDSEVYTNMTGIDLTDIRHKIIHPWPQSKAEPLVPTPSDPARVLPYTISLSPWKFSIGR